MPYPIDELSRSESEFVHLTAALASMRGAFDSADSKRQKQILKLIVAIAGLIDSSTAKADDERR